MAARLLRTAALALLPLALAGCVSLGGAKPPPSLLTLTPVVTAPAGSAASAVPAEALMVMEDALATVGVCAVFGEVEAVDLTAGRRLQLACEKRGGTGFVIRRRPFGGSARKEATGSVAATRWRVGPAPSEPPAGEFGLGAPRWRVELERCRGGRTGAWTLEAAEAYSWEAGDVAHPLRLVAELADRQLAPAQPAHQRAA